MVGTQYRKKDWDRFYPSFSAVTGFWRLEFYWIVSLRDQNEFVLKPVTRFMIWLSGNDHLLWVSRLRDLIDVMLNFDIELIRQSASWGVAPVKTEIESQF